MLWSWTAALDTVLGLFRRGMFTGGAGHGVATAEAIRDSNWARVGESLGASVP